MHRVRGLDGLRALAVLAVIQQHWGVASLNRAIGPGGFGVNCFFVLSGFLITGILLNTRQPGDHARALTTFYLRRALRIFPAYYVMLAVAALVTRDVAEQWPWHAAYLSNVKLALDQRWPGAAAHLWSLSVEEQFYLVWPALVLFTPPRLLERVIAGIVMTGPIVRLLILSATDGNQFAAANSLPGASDCLAIGGLLACRRERGAPALPHVTLAAGVLVWIGGHIAGRVSPGSDIPVIAGGTSAALMFAWIVDRVSRAARGTRWLAWQPLVFVGTVSYGIYLVHNFVPALTNLVDGRAGSWLYAHGAGQFVAVSMISIGIATVSWYVMERPLNDLKRYFPYTRPRLSDAGSAETDDDAEPGLHAAEPHDDAEPGLRTLGRMPLSRAQDARRRPAGNVTALATPRPAARA